MVKTVPSRVLDRPLSPFVRFRPLQHVNGQFDDRPVGRHLEGAHGDERR